MDTLLAVVFAAIVVSVCVAFPPLLFAVGGFALVKFMDEVSSK